MRSIILLTLTLLSFSIKAGEIFEDLIIEKIQCIGNDETNCEIIKKDYHQNVGDVVSPEKIQSARIVLGTKGLFDKVEISLNKGSEKGKVIVEIAVKERSSIQASISSYNTIYLEDGLDGGYLGSGFQAEVSEYNLFGTGKVLTAFTRFNISNNLGSLYTNGIKFSDPHLFGSRDYFFDYQLTYDGDREDLFSERYNSFNFGKRFGQFHSVSLSATRKKDKNILYSGSKFNNGYTEYGLNYIYDNLNDLYFPSEGTRFNASLLVRRMKGINRQYSEDGFGFVFDLQEFIPINEGSSFEVGLRNSLLKNFSPYWSVYNDEVINRFQGDLFYHQFIRKDQFESTFSNFRYYVGPQFFFKKDFLSDSDKTFHIGDSDYSTIWGGLKSGISTEVGNFLVNFDVAFISRPIHLD